MTWDGFVQYCSTGDMEYPEFQTRIFGRVENAHSFSSLITIQRKTTRNDSVRMRRNRWVVSIAIHGLLGGATSLNAKTSLRWLVPPRDNVLAGVSDFCPCLHSTYRRNPRSKTTFLQKRTYKSDTPPNDDGVYAISTTQCLVDVDKYWHIFADVATVASERLDCLQASIWLV